MVKNLMRNLAFILFLLVSATACRDDIDGYYERPDWLRGTALDVLNDMGDYSYFIEAVKNSDYSDLLDGRGLCTVFAPCDSAFSAWLQQKYSTDDITVVPKDTLNLIVGSHILNYSYKKSELLAFSTTGDALEGSNGDGSSFHYESPVSVGVTKWKSSFDGRRALIYNEKKYIPIISTKLFQTREVDAEKNYKFFFPDVNWRGSENELYITSASVKQYAIPTDNGYLYTLDKVAEPLTTVYDAMAKSPSARLFSRMFDSYANLEYSSEYSMKYGGAGDSIFLLWHGDKPGVVRELPEIASEKSYHGEQGVDMMKNQAYATTCLAPTDKVLKKYFADFLTPYGGFNENIDVENMLWDETAPLTTQMFLILKAHSFDKKELLLPEEIEKGFSGEFGEKYSISMDRLAAQPHSFCSNGVYYGIDTVLEPYTFKAVTRIALRYPQYNVVRAIIDRSDSYKLFVDKNRDYTMFIHNDSLLEEKNKWIIEWGVVSDYGDEQIIDAERGNEVKVTGAPYQYLLRHSFNNALPDPMSISDTLKYFRSMEDFYYVYMDGGVMFDQTNQPINTVYKYNECDNGTVYELGEVFSSPNDQLARMVFANNPLFHRYMLQTGLAEADQRGNVKYPWANRQRLMAFIPTDEAIQALVDNGSLPLVDSCCVTEQDSLKTVKFLQSYFVSIETNNMSDYILPNYGYDNSYSCITAVDFKHSADMVLRKISWVKGERILHLEAKTPNGTETIQTADALPVFAKDGILYKLNKCFTPDI